jgi:hypothetical protein
MAVGFFDARATPEQLAERRRQLDALAGRMGRSPTIGGGIGDFLTGLVGGFSRYKLDKAEGANAAAADKEWSAFNPFGPPMPPAGAGPAMAAPAGDMAAARKSIADIESGGRYDALGPVTKKGDRAYGKYQVMGANIPQWSKEALGREVTPQEFLANPELQDAIFDHRFGSYLKQHGPANAASMWFTGRPLSEGAGRKDQLGTSGQAYADRFLKGFGQQPQAPKVDVSRETMAPPGPPQIIPAGAPGQPQQPMDSPMGQLSNYQKMVLNAAQEGKIGIDDPRVRQIVEQLRGQGQPLPKPIQAAQMGAGGRQPDMGAIPPQPAAPPPQAPGQPANLMPQAQQPTAPQGVAGPQGGDNGRIQQLMQLSANPWLSPEKKAIAAKLLEQEMQKQDPSYQMGLEKQRLELDQMRNPPKKPPIEVGGRLIDPDTFKPVYEPPPPKPEIVTAKDGSVLRIDESGAKVIYGGRPEKFTQLTPQQEIERGLDPTGAYQIGPDDKVYKIGGEGTTVNIDQKSEGAFEKKLAEKQAESFDVMATDGMNARAEIGLVNRLESLMQGQGGMATGLAAAAASWGIATEGMSDLQAAEAIINKLVPSQRAPGSGSMSDRDVELFKASLPSLWTQPGGNAKIIETMRGLSQYKQAQGDIAQRVQAGEMSRQDAVRALKALTNPLAQNKAIAPVSGKAELPAGWSQEEFDVLTPDEKKELVGQ